MNPTAFHELADILPEPLLLVDSSGRIHLYNPPAAGLLGLAGDSPGCQLSDYLDESDRERLPKYLAACSRTRSLIPGSLTLPDPEGGTRVYRCRGAVVRPRSDDEPALLLLRVQPEEPAMSRFALLNRKLDELTREVRIRKKVEEERALLLATERELREQLELQTVELEQQQEEAQQLTEELELTNDQLTRALAVAETANRAKGDFLAMMSHELRTPINATIGYLELIMLGLRGPLTEDQRRDIERIRRNQQHLLRVVTDILTFSRADAGRLEFELSEFSVADVVEAVALMLEPLAHERTLRIVVQPCAPEMRIRADHAKVEQILVNLVANAFKFSPRGGEVAVSCAAESDMVAVRVRDRGPGIPPDKIEQIFQPFVQLEATLTRRIEGTGLGLTISREFARGMGGDLKVESGPEGGAVFTLLLPAAATVPILPALPQH